MMGVGKELGIVGKGGGRGGWDSGCWLLIRGMDGGRRGMGTRGAEPVFLFVSFCAGVVVGVAGLLDPSRFAQLKLIPSMKKIHSLRPHMCAPSLSSLIGTVSRSAAGRVGHSPIFCC